MTALQIVIEAVQFTAGREPVIVQYAAKDAATGGPFARTQLHHTTQSALAGRASGQTRDADYWSDAEVAAELVAHLASFGVTAEVVPHDVAEPQPDVPFTPPGVTMPDEELQ
jgi:hypothetical protein